LCVFAQSFAGRVGYSELTFGSIVADSTRRQGVDTGRESELGRRMRGSESAGMDSARPEREQRC